MPVALSELKVPVSSAQSHTAVPRSSWRMRPVDSVVQLVIAGGDLNFVGLMSGSSFLLARAAPTGEVFGARTVSLTENYVSVRAGKSIDQPKVAAPGDSLSRRRQHRAADANAFPEITTRPIAGGQRRHLALQLVEFQELFDKASKVAGTGDAAVEKRAVRPFLQLAAEIVLPPEQEAAHSPCAYDLLRSYARFIKHADKHHDRRQAHY